jgi:hypothetical protein
MKNIVFLSALVCFFFASCDRTETPEPAAAIQFSLANDSSLVTGRVSSFELDAYIMFKNLENKSISIKWVRYDELKSNAAWEIATCDNVTCYAPSINSQTITVAAMDSFSFKIVFRPQSITGIGSAKVKFFDPADSARTVKEVYFQATTN